MKARCSRREAALAWGAFALLAAGLMAAFALAAAHTYRWGFPLDDAWIHQTYARNLARWGQWAYRPGQPSAGATAPLWVALMAMGQAVGVPPLWWSAVWGWLALTALAWGGWCWWKRAVPAPRGWWPWAVGLSLLGCWHMVWAALSGMETAWFALAMTALLVAGSEAVRTRHGAWWVAVAVGGAVWLRPEALLAMPWLALAAWRGPEGEPPTARWAREAVLGLGFAVPFAAYLLFNEQIAGHFWPNTFYAKHAEYAALTARPLLERLVRVTKPLAAGGAALFLPLAAGQSLADGRAGRWGNLAAPGWAVTHLLAYAWRLPVAYQHGRYVLPVLPVVVWLGWRGLALLWAWRGSRAAWVISRGTVAAALAVQVAFLPLGAQAFAADTALIESEMVTVAQWLQAHAPSYTVVAAHDIGALGYFTTLPLVDMAGLVSPAVIPMVRNEQALRRFLDQQGTQVVVTFPDWYATLLQGRRPCYAPPQGWGPRLGSTHLTVYCWTQNCAILCP